MRGTLLLFGLLSLAWPAAAQDRPAALRPVLSDLAYVLGESHALRQACQGAADQHWRTRMIRLIEVERPDLAFQARLQEAFNTGYASAKAAHAACTASGRRAEGEAAVRGRALSLKLSAAQRPAAPPSEPVAEDQPAL